MFMTQLSQDKVVYFLTATVLFLLIVTLPNEPGLDCMFSSGTLATETILTFDNWLGFNMGLMGQEFQGLKKNQNQAGGHQQHKRELFSTLPHSF